MDADLLDPAAADLQPPETFPAQPPEDVDLDDVGDDQVGQEVAITPDGGLVKKILVKGSGWEKPEKGDKVSVHYVGTLEDGTPFDSSRERGDLFEFELGQGRVIKGWDLGVATMKKGEKSVLICKSDYAYGAQGSPPKIPPNATLHFEVELFSWTSLKDISGDGGVIKTITKDGEGWDTPRDRDEVVVHYTAHKVGSAEPFLTTPEAGETFSLLTGHPLSKGITRAVATMKKGEHVHLKLSPEYGFGAAATEAGVPADADTEVYLSLERVLKVQDVTDDGGVIKKVLRSDEESYKMPNDGASVTVRYTGTLPDGSVFDARPEGNELTFTLEEGAVVEGLEAAIQKMKKGELARVDVAPQYGYGSTGGTGSLADVPPDTPLVYEVELVDFVNTKESWEMKDDLEKIEAARTRKDKGNAAFKAGKLAAAAKAYEKAVGYINYDKEFSEDNKAAAREVKKSCWLNLAQVNLKQGDHKAATSNCNKVLELEPMNVKALYRVAQANIGTGDLLEAEMAIKRGLLAEEANPDLLALSKKLKVLAKEQNKKEASLYGRMFRPSPTPKHPPAPAPTPAANGTAADGIAPHGAAATRAAAANGDAGIGPIEPGEEVTSAPTPLEPVAGATAAGAEPGLSEAAQVAAMDDGGIDAVGAASGLQETAALSEAAIAAASGEAMGDAATA